MMAEISKLINVLFNAIMEFKMYDYIEISIETKTKFSLDDLKENSRCEMDRAKNQISAILTGHKEDDECDEIGTKLVNIIADRLHVSYSESHGMSAFDLFDIDGDWHDTYSAIFDPSTDTLKNSLANEWDDYPVREIIMFQSIDAFTDYKDTDAIASVIKYVIEINSSCGLYVTIPEYLFESYAELKEKLIDIGFRSHVDAPGYLMFCGAYRMVNLSKIK